MLLLLYLMMAANASILCCATLEDAIVKLAVHEYYDHAGTDGL